HAERMQARDRVPQERRNRLVSRLRVRTGEAHERDVAVAWKAHVVELDLVEPRLRRRDGDVDVVAPRGTRVRVQPGEPAVRLPERAVAAPDGELRVRDGGDRVFEADDATDQVHARRVRLPGDATGIEV